MKTNVERLEATKVKLTVEVPHEELSDAMDKAYKNLSEQVSIPGFRKGHVPRQIIDQRIGRGYVIEEAINEKLGDFYAKAVTENDIYPMGRPDVDVTETPTVTGKLEGKLVFTAEVVCQPEFDLPSVDKVDIEVDPATVDDSQVEEELDQLRDRFSSLIGVDRAVEEGDYTSIDMVATIDGEQVDSVSGVSYQQGSGTMLGGLDEALLGMKEGDSKDFDTEFVGGEHTGEKGKATVTVNKVKVKELPEADDEFAMMASEFDTIGELRQDLRQSLEQRMADKQGMDALDKLREYIVDNSDVEVPESVVEEQLSSMNIDSLEDDQKKKVEENVRNQLRTDIVMDKLARESDVKLEENELLQAIMQISQMYGVEPGQLMSSQEQIASIAAQLTQNKALTLMLEGVNVKDTKGTKVDLTDFIERAKPKEDDSEDDTSKDDASEDDK